MAGRYLNPRNKTSIRHAYMTNLRLIQDTLVGVLEASHRISGPAVRGTLYSQSNEACEHNCYCMIPRSGQELNFGTVE